MVNNHGDRFRPLRIGLWDPFQMAFLFLWLINEQSIVTTRVGCFIIGFCFGGGGDSPNLP